MARVLRFASWVLVASAAHLIGCREQTSALSQPPPPSPSSAPSGAPASVVRSDAEHLTYHPLPGWSDRRAELASGLVDPVARAKAEQPPKGEVFHLDGPPASGFGIDLTALDVPADTDPVAALRAASDRLRDALAKGGLSYAVIAPPRRMKTQEGINGAELYERWEIDGRWQRDAQRMFVRNRRAYLLRCSWSDTLGDDPPDARRALDGIQFDP